jgi:hypothetical protein
MNRRPIGTVVAGFSAWLTTGTCAMLAHAAPAQADDIRDIRPLILIPPWWYWLAASAAAALIIALVFAAIRYWRRRSERALTPAQHAQRALLQAQTLARNGQCREWAELVATTLRAALAARLGHDACPETTNELAALDWEKVPNGSTVDSKRLVELLSTCDLTRFALGRLDPAALLDETEAARAWITRLFTDPKPSITQPASNAVEATP